MRSRCFVAVLVLMLLPAVREARAAGKAADKSAATTLLLDYQTRRLCRLDKATVPTRDEKGNAITTVWACPANSEWHRSGDHFKTGDIVRLLVANGRLLSRFKVAVNGTPIADEVFIPRGVTVGAAETPKAADAPQPPTKGGPGAPIPTLEQLFRAADLALASAAAKTSLAAGPPAVAVPLAPGSSIASITKFAEGLKIASTTSLTQIPFVDLAAFADYLDRADALAAAIVAVGARITDAVSASATAVSAAVAYLDAAKAAGAGPAAPADLLPAGARFSRIDSALIALDKSRRALETDVQLLNETVQAAFDNINALYRQSRSAEPFELMIGQYSSGMAVQFDVSEQKGFTAYTLSPASTTATVKVQDPGKAIGVTKDVDAQKDAVKTPAPEPDKPFFTGNFDVHRLYHANVASGFALSTLRNRDYGVQQVPVNGADGKPLYKDGQAVLTYVPTIGDDSRPQVHYYVGADIYFRAEDFFPGARHAVIPALMIGYGLDQPFNFFFGPNFETKIGLNIGGGWHIGRETFLAPGVVAGPGGTQLAVDKAPATVQRFDLKHGWYFNIGFDYQTFKSIFGAATGMK